MPKNHEMEPHHSMHDFLSQSQTYRGILNSKNPNVQLAIRVLSTNPLPQLNMETQAQFLVQYIFEHETTTGERTSDLEVPYDLQQAALYSTLDKYQERYARFRQLIGLSLKLKKEYEHYGKPVYLSDFDVWVYNQWEVASKKIKEFAVHSVYPSEFFIPNETLSDRMDKIKISLKRLEHFEVIDEPYADRRVSLRLEKLLTLIERDAEILGPDVIDSANLALEIGVDRSTIVHDIQALRRQDLLLERTTAIKPVTRKNLDAIQKAIQALEITGRKYDQGQIGQDEIASLTQLPLGTIRELLFKYGAKIGIGKISGSLRSKANGDSTREQVERLLNEGKRKDEIPALVERSQAQVDVIIRSIRPEDSELRRQQRQENIQMTKQIILIITSNPQGITTSELFAQLGLTEPQDKQVVADIVYGLKKSGEISGIFQGRMQLLTIS